MSGTDSGVTTLGKSGMEVPKHGSVKALMAGSIGQILEGYDFLVYASLAIILGKEFFPANSPAGGVLAAFAAFGVGFVVRPLGGIVIGRFADRVGRKPALLLTILVMGLGTLAMGLLPNYATAGFLGAVLLVVCRLVQGFAYGAEWPGSTAYVVEWAAAGRRGFFGSIGQASGFCGYLLGLVIVAIVTMSVSTTDLDDWGWRIPFIIGGVVLLPIGLILRSRIDETPEFIAKHAEAEKAPSEVSTGQVLGWILRIIGLAIFWNVSVYAVAAFLPTLATKFVGLDPATALWATAVGWAVMTVTTPISGYISDHVGRRPVLLVAAIPFLVVAFPLYFWLTASANVAVVFVVAVITGLLIGIYSGAGPAALSEQIPTIRRALWMSTAYSISVALFGGFAPYVSTWIAVATGSALMPILYPMAAAVVSIVAIVTASETGRRALR